MRIRKGRYFLSRVVKINLSQEELMDAICHPAIIRVGKYNWTITDMVDKRDDESLPFIYGKLVKYADDTQDVVDEYNHTQDQSITANLVKASSPFVYLSEFSGLCFLHVYNDIESETFPRRFKRIIEDSRKLKYNDLLIECDVDAISDYASFFNKIILIKKITQIEATVSPPNPLFGRIWKSLNDTLKERNTSTLRINEESEKREGLKTNLHNLVNSIEENNISNCKQEVALTDAAILMAADGYGRGKVAGEGENGEMIEVRTKDAQKSFLFEKNPSPNFLARKANEEFMKVSEERKMEH
ncbi:hypothetical protein [Kingella sp. (in: b-proteobacteria)]|uniref:hypothetical protein n=1 Tax=Kingella sp. (in: b-proteobacteria) TaxID=2020713 RepID=UPI0026DB58EA|nr:hypothetical protein [Kingella sp. (in: b-proteobacteria)]MDO4656212.1 hypothetical protein [Kingella sp. (in: b-proteobacteria)]